MRDFLATLAHLFRPQRSNRHRPRVLHPEAFAFYAVLLIWVAAAVPWFTARPGNLPTVLGYSSSITPEQVIDQTNQVRRAQGFEPLVYNATLTDAAHRKGLDMLDEQYWAHVSPAGKQPWAFMTEAGYRYKVAGENLARDFSNTPDMIQAWFNSPTHKANLLNGRYREIGVAVVNGKLNGYETTVVVQMFGTQKTEPVSLPAQVDQQLVSVVAAPQELSVPAAIFDSQISARKGEVLAGEALVAGNLSAVKPLLSPKLIFEVVAIAAVILLLSALICDWVWVHPVAKHTRSVGHNLAHVLYLLTIAALIVLYRSGRIF